MNIKDGWRTTEFWTSITTAILGIGVLFGFITPEESDKVNLGLSQIVGGLMTVVPIVAYSVSRGRAKTNITADSISDLIESLTTTYEDDEEDVENEEE